MKKYQSFSILDNHFHLVCLIERPKQFSLDLQCVFGRSSYEINKISNRIGHFWGRHFVLTVEDEENFNKVLGYILGNPLRHGLVKDLEGLYNYRFCNYKYFCKRDGIETMESLVLANLELKVEEK